MMTATMEGENQMVGSRRNGERCAATARTLLWKTRNYCACGDGKKEVAGDEQKEKNTHTLIDI